MLKKVSSLIIGLLASVAVWAAPTIEFTTTMGKFTLELNPEKAPRTVEWFLYNAKHGFYEATIFHRVIDGFMIQGGGFNQAMAEKKVLTPRIKNESNNGLSNTRGTVAMARTSDPDSARVQFFINHKDNDSLNYPNKHDPSGFGYTVFGKVIQGMDTVDNIAKVPTGNIGNYQNVPNTPIIIKEVKVISEK